MEILNRKTGRFDLGHGKSEVLVGQPNGHDHQERQDSSAGGLVVRTGGAGWRGNPGTGEPHGSGVVGAKQLEVVGREARKMEDRTLVNEG